MKGPERDACLLVLTVSLCAVTSVLCEPNGLRFENVAASAGLKAQIRCGSPEKRWISEANGTGVAWLDYDNDGLMDLLIVNGGTMAQLRKIVSGKELIPASNSVYLFHNLGHGRFEDVTAKSGLTNHTTGAPAQTPPITTTTALRRF